MIVVVGGGLELEEMPYLGTAADGAVRARATL